MRIKVRRGLDVPVEGAPEQTITDVSEVPSVALVGSDYVGLEPRMRVQVGDRVRAGQPLFEQKRDPDILFTAPASGVVKAINRGARRVLTSVVIDLEDDEGPEAEPPVRLAGLSVRTALQQTGLWTAFRTRPFSHIPATDASPGSIFVTALDTEPLAADQRLVVAGDPAAFERGLSGLAELTDGPIYLCTAPGWNGPVGDTRQVEFEGPHPAGLPGTHIHHLDPVGADYQVWHISAQDVMAVGRLLKDGCLSLQRIIALGGGGFRQPRLVQARLGADLLALTAGEITTPETTRVFSGSVLSGREAAGSEAYLGRYHQAVAALPIPPAGRVLRWRRLVDGRFSFAGTFARAAGGSTRSFTTDQNGRATALVPLDAFEKLIPMDVLTEPLLRALLVGDTDQAQALGALELAEEDLALCSFICPGKNDYGAVLRANLTQIEAEG